MKKIFKYISDFIRIQSLGRALLIRVLVFSSVITLLLTIFQILMEYRDGTRVIESQIDQVLGTVEDSLANSIWMINEEQIKLHLKGLSQYPAVSSVYLLTDSGDEFLLEGNYIPSHPMIKNEDLHYADGDKLRKLGDLTITLSLEPLYSTLRSRVAIILLSNALKTFLVSLFILSLYRSLIGKHLESIAGYTSALDAEHLDSPLVLDRIPYDQDEIYSITSAINKMREQLKEDFQILEDERRALLESESRIETVSSNLPGFIFQLRGNWKHVNITFLSEGLYRYFGIDPVAHRQDLNAASNYFEKGQWKMILEDSKKQLMAQGRYIEDTPVLIDTDQRKWIRIIINCDKTTVGDYIFNGLVIDITAQKELELHRLAMEQRMANQQKMEALGTLSSGIAHNFNNIIQGISNTLFLLKKDRSPEQRATILERGESFLSQGKSLVENILTYGRTQENKAEAYDIIAVIKETVELFKSSISSQHEIKINLTDTVIDVKGDRGLFAQAILNLLINADHAIEKGNGEILIEAALEDDDKVKVTVKDNGQGINSTHLPRIFDPFFTTKPLGVGTGLGLYFVYNVVSEHHGKINVSSKVDNGTSFEILIPKMGSEKVLLDEKAFKEKRKICLVDDHEALTEMLKEALERKNCEVLSFNDPNLALKSIKAERYDFVISDQNMPGMLGNDFAWKVKDSGFTGHFVLISGNPTVREHEGNVIHATLRKPFKLQELIDVLDSFNKV